MKRLASVGMLAAAAAFGVPAEAENGCMVIIDTCACDQDLGGPGFFIYCPRLPCSHDILECWEGTKCVATGVTGHDDCAWTGTHGLCDANIAECIDGECRIGTFRWTVLHKFSYPTGDACAVEE